ncbi:putative nuclear condensing complex subunits, C-term domain [Lyophyllum shimeji]|uniref:Nuclear condensing complex subunits, C-term domain n=1 Tax=Lyophyllum shimeji TaxID=47721 RepID=A0A9P3PUT4_LYOSH|nr:putative nuclear condensing complex subunits, C-term domain [Lyophyllum shimeji]
MPGRTLQADEAAVREQVSTQVPRILDQAQSTTANHQKNLVALYKVQTHAAGCMEQLKKGRVKLIGEKIFEEAIFHMLMRVLPVKKGVAQADRVVKFVGQYIKFVNEKAAEDKNADEEAHEDEDTTASRFTARLLKFLFKGFAAKDKWVRYRVLQTVAEMVSHLGEVEEEIYTDLRSSLLDRANDKEAIVRVQAVIALSRLANAEDPSEVEAGESLQDVLIDMLQHDSSPEVRRAVLCNIPVNPTTLPHIVNRARDTDTAIRKLVYASVLDSNITVGETDVMGPTHPRTLSIAQRELIIRHGLGDRELSVRTAAASLLGKWVDVLGERPTKKEEEEEGKPKPKSEVKIESGVVALLRMLDLNESTGVAVDAVLSVFATRTEIFENMEFGNEYWESLTSETAFLARVFVEHGRATKDETRLEAALPEVTALAFRIQGAYNKLTEDAEAEEEEKVMRELTDDEKMKWEELRLENELIVGELLRLAVNLDYSDEIGRRKMFQLVRDMLSRRELPEALLNTCLDVLRELSVSERDLIRVVVEIVQDLRDRGDEDEEEDPTVSKDADAETTFGETPATVRPPRTKKPVEELTPEERKRADGMDLRCLSLCIGMLERVNGTLEDNLTLEGILKELILPSVRRKEVVFREQGLLALGLCCSIAKRLALDSITMFVVNLFKSPEELQPSLLKVIFDVLMVHHQELRKERPNDYARILPALTTLLGSATSDKVLALLCIGLSKLVLAGMITDHDVVKNLIKAYLSPATVDNQELRQCLTFFFPVYCYSSPINQRTMREIFLGIYKALNDDRKELGDEEEMITAAQVTALFLDWTDPAKLRSAVNAREKAEAPNQADMAVQLDMAIDILKSLLESNWAKEDKKVLCQLLPKLYIPDTVDDDKIKELKVLMYGLRSRRPLRDTTTNNAFTKFETAINKKFEKQLEDFSEEEYRKLEQLEQLFSWLDEIIPEDDDEVISLDEPKKKGRKRRSESISTTTTDGAEVASTTSSRRGRSKSKSKRHRLSNSDYESDEEVTELGTPPPESAPTRTLPKRSAATKKPVQVIEISSDSDEEQATPVPRGKRSKQRSALTSAGIKEEEQQLDAEIDQMLDSGSTTEIPFDSIIDGSQDDDEEEEEEVNDLLAGD